MKKVLYTAITGNYDSINEPVKTPGWEYKLLMNNLDIKPVNWEVLPIVHPLQRDPPKMVRYLKLHPWELFDADISIWVDANIQVTCDLDKFITDYKQGEFTIMKHPDRNCIYKELSACETMRKDNADIMKPQIARYKEEGYPAENGLVSSGLIIRKHTQGVKDFCIKWWDEIARGSHRDQLSFNYVAWKINYKFEYMPFLFNNPASGLIFKPGHKRR